MSSRGADGTADGAADVSASAVILPFWLCRPPPFCSLDILLSILHSLHVSTCSNIFILCIPCGTACSAAFLFDNSTPTQVLLDCRASDSLIACPLFRPSVMRLVSAVLAPPTTCLKLAKPSRRRHRCTPFIIYLKAQ